MFTIIKFCLPTEKAIKFIFLGKVQTPEKAFFVSRFCTVFANPTPPFSNSTLSPAFKEAWYEFTFANVCQASRRCAC